jgi:hypothetical protein
MCVCQCLLALVFIMVTVFASWGGGLDPKGVLELLLGPWRWYTGWDVAQNGLLVDVQNGIG